MVLTGLSFVEAAEGDFCAAVQVVPISGDARALVAPRAGYSASDVLDLELRTSLQGELRGTHLLELGR